MKATIIVALFLTLFGASYAVDKCPDVKFMENFDHKRFLGRWYGIVTTGIDMPCGSYELFDIGSTTNYKMILHPANVNIELSRKGKTLDEGFNLKTPFELLNNSNMRIFTTDYDNYAVVIECKNLGGPIYLAVTIGSRQKTLDSKIVEKLKSEVVAKTGIDISGMKPIDHVQCY
ncbi:apolipoprotein D-like [Chironomus tepperi]|uniref:apolipoprotein D-like n=1 Tax=Chironomus tepperi TaxID=113505 RepID=UPI00391FC92C